MPTVALQMGHCFRQKGSTGTSGFDPNSNRIRTEQDFTAAIGSALAVQLEKAGAVVELLTADEYVPPCDVFIALHQDGSSSSTPRGGSFGYSNGLKLNPLKRTANPEDAELSKILKAYYTLAGWPSGFRPDNYTSALSGYYGWRRSEVRKAQAACLIEHGFATNPADQGWMWAHLPQIAAAHTAAITHYLGFTGVPEEAIEDVLHIRHDKTKNWYWSVDPTAPQPIKEIQDPADLKLDGVPIERSDSMRYLMKHHWGLQTFTEITDNADGTKTKTEVSI